MSEKQGHAGDKASLDELDGASGRADGEHSRSEQSFQRLGVMGRDEGTAQ